MTTTDPKLIESVVSHLANRFLQYPLPKDFRPDNGVSVQRPNYAPSVPWTIYGTNLLDAEQAKAMVRFMLEGAPIAAAINEAVQNERAGRMDHWTMRAALKSIRALVKAGDALSFAAQTTGGTAGSDTHLMVANLHWCAERDKHLQALRIIELEHDDPEIGAGILAPPAIEAKESQHG